MYLQCDLSVKQNIEPAPVLWLDPPWAYNDQRKVRKDGKTPTRGIGQCHHYTGVPTEELATWPLGDYGLARSHMYMWAVAPKLADAFLLMEAYEYNPVTVAFCWVKTNPLKVAEIKQRLRQLDMFDAGLNVPQLLDGVERSNPGFYTMSNVELVLIGRKGRAFKHAKGRKLNQVFFAPINEHSRKPEIPQDREAWMYPQIKHRIELFGRRDRVGYTVLGNEQLFPLYEGGEP